ncbi:MAG: hypothetical protein ABIH66_04190 [bacterium]
MTHNNSSARELCALPGMFRAGALLLLFVINFVSLLQGSIEGGEKPAGRVRDEILIRVTGRSATPDFLEPLILREIEMAVGLEPGAKYKIEKAPKSVIRDTLKSGSSMSCRIPLRIFGAGYAEVRKEAVVRINNIVIEDVAKDGVFYASNSPEEIHEAGALLGGRLEPFRPVRILVHHKNASEKDLHFGCVLYNASGEPAQVHVIEGPVSVSKDELRTGHFAAVNFFRNLIDGNGKFVTIAPGETYALFRKDFPSGKVISYLGELTLLSSASVGFSIRTLYPYHRDVAYLQMHSPSQLSRPHGEFPLIVIETRDRYSIGGRWLHVSVGDRPVDSIDYRNKLHGNYGLLHEIVVEVSNSTPRAEKLGIYLRPSAGPASASFIIENEFIEVPHAKSSELKLLKVIPVGSGEERSVRVLTMPEPGSYYPIHLIFGSSSIDSYEKAKDNK